VGSNQSNIPIEMIEVDYPMRIERYGLLADTGGPGAFRGGLSLIREYRLLTDDVFLGVRSDKRDFPPHGLFGGEAGHPSENRVERRDGVVDRLPTLPTAPVTLYVGDLFRHVMAGGGGYGDPYARDPMRVLEDVLDGKVSAAAARDRYGVVIVEGRPPRSMRLQQNG
jgi:N-methylhydantoinase B